MNFMADENVDRQIVERLRQDGHDVLYVAEMEPGISDDEVLKRANDSQSLLLTVDKDFGELVYRLRKLHNGVVLIRLGDLSPNKKAEIVSHAISQNQSSLENSFSVISPGQLRIRQKY
jgi:predicted nuclease of predicted toxin-antitoxin system